MKVGKKIEVFIKYEAKIASRVIGVG